MNSVKMDMNSTVIGYKSLPDIVQSIAELSTDQILFVCDKKVHDLWKSRFLLSGAGFAGKVVIEYIVDDAEAAKSYSEFAKAAEFFLSKGIHRKAHLIALGGGALSDFAGFLAATLLRGIQWSVIPTTLLSMVDAGIGGKTALNSQYGKNLIGAFHLPVHVWINTDFLETLPQDDIESGKGEILKYAFLSKDIFDLVTKRDSWNEIIQACACFKQRIVDEDFKEGHLRQILNFGHTFGHAFEKILCISHGRAVVLGIEFILQYIQNGQLLEIFEKLLGDLEIKKFEYSSSGINARRFFDYIVKDKKKDSARTLNLILAREIGAPEIVSFQINELASIIDRIFV